MGAMMELSTEQRSALPTAWIDRLFARMEDRYGKLWSDRYGMAPRDRLMQTWSEDLADLTRDELVAGVTACRDVRLPPTLPEFRAMCRPPINYEAAFYETVEQLRLREDGRDQWPKPALYWASRLVGGDMMRFPYRDLQTRWRNALDASMREEQTAVPPRREALPAPGGTTTPSVAKAAAAVLRQMTSQPKDPLAWARKIMERKEAGELMPTISIEFAAKALATES